MDDSAIAPTVARVMAEEARLAQLRSAITEWHERLLRPGSGRIVRMSGPTVNPKTGEIVVAGQSFESLDRAPTSKLYRLDLARGRLVRISHGIGDHIEPRFAPDGSDLVFRRGRADGSGYDACLLDPSTEEMSTLAALDGSVEYAGWLPEGKRVALLVADPGVSLASVQGATATARTRADRPNWLPDVDDSSDLPRRTLWTVDALNGQLNRIETGCNLWEICAAGANAVAAVATDNPAEDAWYRADLRLIDVNDQSVRRLYTPKRQIVALSSNNRGTLIAFVEGLASDRGHLAADLLLMDAGTGKVRKIDTLGVDVGWTGWRGDQLIAAGIRGDHMVLLTIDPSSDRATLVIAIHGVNGGQRYPLIAVTRDPALRAVVVLHSIEQAERLAIISAEGVQPLLSLATPEFEAAVRTYGPERFRPVEWRASDGEQIDGWLHTPLGDGPFPLAMLVHGGPVMRWIPKSILDFALQAALADQGFAQFMPNPRGSTGRGQRYAEAILGDMGGLDARDLLEGIDMLVSSGIADRDRLAVTGISHGGFMSCWLVTQDRRFKAAAAVSPISDWKSQQLTSDIPSFNDVFIGTPRAGAPSPILFADRVEAAVLLIAGALDRCTPPAQAEEFHRALRLAGRRSTLVVYPNEGHGIRSIPAASIDHIARIVSFFEKRVMVKS